MRIMGIEGRVPGLRPPRIPTHHRAQSAGHGPCAECGRPTSIRQGQTIHTAGVIAKPRPPKEPKPPKGPSARQLEAVATVAAHGGSQKLAAEALGISRSALRVRLIKWSHWTGEPVPRTPRKPPPPPKPRPHREPKAPRVRRVREEPSGFRKPVRTTGAADWALPWMRDERPGANQVLPTAPISTSESRKLSVRPAHCSRCAVLADHPAMDNAHCPVAAGSCSLRTDHEPRACICGECGRLMAVCSKEPRPRFANDRARPGDEPTEPTYALNPAGAMHVFPARRFGDIKVQPPHKVAPYREPVDSDSPVG